MQIYFSRSKFNQTEKFDELETSWVNEVETRKINQDFFTAASSTTIKSGGEMEKKASKWKSKKFSWIFLLLYSSSDFEKKIQFHYQRGFYW